LCDTDFWGTDGLNGGKFETAESLAAQVKQFWPKDTNGTPYVVCTGGEPMLQLDSVLIDALHAQGFEVAVETNGTILPPPGLDWICVSPKANTTLLITKGNELKLVYPQTGAAPTQFEDLNFEHFFLQPMDGPDIQENTQLTLKYCLSHPKWRLSLQTHKILDIL
jgi:7-carboxy-7-deazaguanine synthase (Cx14CxxC type)